MAERRTQAAAVASPVRRGIGALIIEYPSSSSRGFRRILGFAGRYDDEKRAGRRALGACGVLGFGHDQGPRRLRSISARAQNREHGRW